MKGHSPSLRLLILYESHTIALPQSKIAHPIFLAQPKGNNNRAKVLDLLGRIIGILAFRKLLVRVKYVHTTNRTCLISDPLARALNRS